MCEGAPLPTGRKSLRNRLRRMRILRGARGCKYGPCVGLGVGKGEGAAALLIPTHNLHGGEVPEETRTRLDATHRMHSELPRMDTYREKHPWAEVR